MIFVLAFEVTALQLGHGDTFFGVKLVGSSDNYYVNIWNFTDGGYTLAIASSGVYYPFLNFALDGSNGFSFNATTKRINVQFSGNYQAIFTTSISCGINGIYGIGLSKNNASPEGTRCYTHVDSPGTGHDSEMFSCIIDLKRGDNVSVVIDDEQNPAQNCNVVQQSFSMVRVGN